MVLRKAVAADLDEISKGYQEHFDHEKQYGAYTVFQEGVYPTREVAEAALHTDALFVYEEKGTVLGSVILDGQQPSEYANIDWPSKASNEAVGVIHLLMVRPSAAGKGIGSALVNYAAGIAKQNGCVVIRLDTGEQNLPAISLYKKLGFHLASSAPIKVGGIISHSHHLFFERRIV